MCKITLRDRLKLRNSNTRHDKKNTEGTTPDRSHTQVYKRVPSLRQRLPPYLISLFPGIHYADYIPFYPRGKATTSDPIHSITPSSNSAAAFLELSLKEANGVESAFECHCLCRASDSAPRARRMEEELEVT